MPKSVTAMQGIVPRAIEPSPHAESVAKPVATTAVGGVADAFAIADTQPIDTRSSSRSLAAVVIVQRALKGLASLIARPRVRPRGEGDAPAARGLASWVGLTAGGDPTAVFRGRPGTDAWIDAEAAERAVCPMARLWTMPRHAVDKLLDQRRQFLTAAFTGVCVKAHDDLAPTLGDLAAAKRMRGKGIEPRLVGNDLARKLEAPGLPVKIQRAVNGGIGERVTTIAYASTKMTATVPGAASVLFAVPVGEHGPALARALVFAAQTMMGAAGNAPSAQPEIRRLLRKFTFQGSAQRISPTRAALAEGAATIASTMALLMAKRMPGLDVEAQLDAALRPLLQLSRGSPFGLLVPLAVHGYVPRGPMFIDGHGRPSMPADLHELMRLGAETRHVAHADAKTLDDESVHINPNETLRGCPVAYAAPALRPDGTLSQPVSGLQLLVTDFIALTKLYLRDEADRARVG